MSLISEALKKAQQEREGQRGSPEAAYGLGPERPVRPLWKSPLVVTAVLVLVLGALGVWLTRPPRVMPQGSLTPLVTEPLTPVPQPQGQAEAPEESAAPAEVVLEPQTEPESKPKPRPEQPEENSKPQGVTELREKNEPRVTAEKGSPRVSPEEELRIKLRTAESADDFVRLYQLLRQQGDESAAFAMVQRGLKAFPEHGVLNRLGLIGYVRAKEYGKALEHAGPALESDPDQPSLLTYRGLCHFHLKDHPRALADFGRSLALDPQATENIYYLALIYDNEGQYETAVRYYRMFLDRHPKNKSFRHTSYIVDRLGQLQRQGK